ncbi:MAG: hypothetical protein Q4C41_06865, partial [Eggerthellaceae bacterium]|nr:hypothetical protein [Eggerthellaceae bacterium]
EEESSPDRCPDAADLAAQRTVSLGRADEAAQADDGKTRRLRPVDLAGYADKDDVAPSAVLVRAHRERSRKRRAVVGVAVASSLVAVAVTAGLVYAFTLGEGLGAKPAEVWSGQEPVAASSTPSVQETTEDAADASRASSEAASASSDAQASSEKEAAESAPTSSSASSSAANKAESSASSAAASSAASSSSASHGAGSSAAGKEK